MRLALVLLVVMLAAGGCQAAGDDVEAPRVSVVARIAAEFVNTPCTAMQIFCSCAVNARNFLAGDADVTVWRVPRFIKLPPVETASEQAAGIFGNLMFVGLGICVLNRKRIAGWRRISRSRDDAFFVQAADEIRGGKPEAATMARAIAMSAGNPDAASAAYIKLRVERLRENE